MQRKNNKNQGIQTWQRIRNIKKKQNINTNQILVVAYCLDITSTGRDINLWQCDLGNFTLFIGNIVFCSTLIYFMCITCWYFVITRKQWVMPSCINFVPVTYFWPMEITRRFGWIQLTGVFGGFIWISSFKNGLCNYR